jgi:protein-L-isoaspartate(D-aspartate) O-methyltransferase
MFDFAAARRMMVDGQVRTADVTDQRIIGAMLELPREHFMPERNASLAYLDLDVPVSAGAPPRRLIKPMVLAKLVQAAEVGPQDRVLDLACGTGYSTALLARLAAHVVALEEDATLERHARENLAAVGASNVEVVTGPLAEGWPAGAPFDVILINGCAEIVPERLIRQLKEGGRLVAVVGRPPGCKATRFLASGGHAGPLPIFDAAAPPLPAFAEPPAFVF